MLTHNNGAQVAHTEVVLKHAIKVSDVRGMCNTLVCTLAGAAKVMAGGVICLFGIALLLTLWLMPVGLVLAFFGTAVMLSGNPMTQ